MFRRIRARHPLNEGEAFRGEARPKWRLHGVKGVGGEEVSVREAFGSSGGMKSPRRVCKALCSVSTPLTPPFLEGDSSPGPLRVEDRDGKCRNPGPGTTCVVGFLQEHLVRLGPQGRLGAVGLAQEDGGGVCWPVPVGGGRRRLSVGQVLRGF